MYKLNWRNDVKYLDVDSSIDNIYLVSWFLQTDMKHDLASLADVINHIDRASNRKEKNISWNGNITHTKFTDNECIIEEIFAEDDDEKCVLDIQEFREIVIAWFEEMTKIKYKQSKISKERYDEIMAVVDGYKK